MQHTYTPTADGRLRARAREYGGSYLKPSAPPAPSPTAAPAALIRAWSPAGALSPRVLRLAAPGHTVTFANGHLPRLSARTTTAATPEGAGTTYDLDDGWNRIAEYSDMNDRHRIWKCLDMSRTTNPIFLTWGFFRCLFAVMLTFTFSCFAPSCCPRHWAESASPEPRYGTESQRIVIGADNSVPFMAMEVNSENSHIYQQITARLADEGIALEATEYYHMLLSFNVKRSDLKRIRQIIKEDARLRKMLEPFISEDFK